jgi:hypothetical protein
MNVLATTATARAASADPDLGAPLVAAASLIAAAALVGHAGVGSVSVTVHGADISVQIPCYIGDEAARVQMVAAYARALGTPVQRRVRQSTWIETHGGIAAHRVHVWTAADDPAPVTPAVA